MKCGHGPLHRSSLHHRVCDCLPGLYTHLGHTHSCACSFLSFALSGSLGGNAFGSLALCSRAPQQYYECVLAPLPTIRTPLKLCSNQDLNKEQDYSGLFSALNESNKTFFANRARRAHRCGDNAAVSSHVCTFTPRRQQEAKGGCRVLMSCDLTDMISSSVRAPRDMLTI